MIALFLEFSALQVRKVVDVVDVIKAVAAEFKREFIGVQTLKQSFVVLKAPSDRGYVYELACPNCSAGADTMKKTAFLKIEKDGKATLSGTIAGTKVSGTTYLSYEYDEYDGEELEVVARFFVGKFVIEIRGDTEYFYSNGSLFGRVWKK